MSLSQPKILITNNQLTNMGGTETWVLTMVRELSKEHKVGVYTKQKGYVSDLIKEYIDDRPRGYDLALVNHTTCINEARLGADFTIFTSHGTEPDLEKPQTGCNYYVAVNENVAEKYNLETIIKNPIDTELFKPTREISYKPNQILAITEKPIPLDAFYPSRVDNNMPELMNKADVVVSMGRGALEAMSCARNVIVWDERGYWGPRGDGYLTLPIKGNVAGPYNKTTINWEEELAKYDKAHGQRNREYILKNHDVRNIAKEYLKIWTNIKSGM